MDFIEVEINNWSRFNTRKDIKHPTWFALNNRILESPSMMELSAEEFKAWIYILSQASQKKSSVVKIYFQHAKRVCSVSRQSLQSAIEKLLKDQSIQVRVRDPKKPVRDPNSTRQDNTEQDNTGTDLKPSFQEIWNHKVSSLPEARTWGEDREKAEKKILEEFKIQDWADVCEKVEKSDFLSGRNKKWLNCGVDWVLKPKNFRKVLEGNYDRGTSQENSMRVVPD